MKAGRTLFVAATAAEAKAAGEPTLPTTAIYDVIAERQRQRERGYDAAHDDEHKACEIIWASDFGVIRRLHAYVGGQHPNPRHALVEAAAMILAEIERLDRQARGP